MSRLVHINAIEVHVPASASRFAMAAEQAGWHVVVTTTHGPARTPEGLEVHAVTFEAQSAEQGGGRKQVVGDVKVIDVVAVRCLPREDRDRADYVVAIWEDGAFDAAYRPLALKVLGSAEALAWVRRRPVLVAA